MSPCDPCERERERSKYININCLDKQFYFFLHLLFVRGKQGTVYDDACPFSVPKVRERERDLCIIIGCIKSLFPFGMALFLRHGIELVRLMKERGG